jgi:hypothetical protein
MRSFLRLVIVLISWLLTFSVSVAVAAVFSALLYSQYSTLPGKVLSIVVLLVGSVVGWNAANKNWKKYMA